MKRLGLVCLGLLALLLGAAGGAAPARERALPCGLPNHSGPATWFDFGWPDLEHVFGRRGVIVAVTSGDFPARMRARGAGTVHWDMYLNRRVGTPNAPADPATIVEKANRLFDYAVLQSGCSTPLIAENELFGANLTTPWSDTNAQYRANVLAFLRQLSARGARPFLLVSNRPYTAGEAGDWWRQVAEVSDIVREVYLNHRNVYRAGPIVGNRMLRVAYRNAMNDLISIGIPAAKLGIMVSFNTSKGIGGREGLEPAEAWFRVAKWQALAARAVTRELAVASVWSWGWGMWSAAEKDPDKLGAACVWLWARDRSLCNAPGVAGPEFDTSLSEGQLALNPGITCRIGTRRLAESEIRSLQRLTGDREVAYTALLARIAEERYAKLTTKRILAAERAVISSRFGGSAAAYRAALAEAGATVAIARGILADELRRAEIERTLWAPPPSAASIATFYRSYPDLLARPVRAKPAASWLGWRPSGYAFAGSAPAAVLRIPTGRKTTVRAVEGSFQVVARDDARPLETLAFSTVAPSIRALLVSFARGDRYDDWSIGRQQAALATAICERDNLPEAGAVDLELYVPFLSTSG